MSDDTEPGAASAGDEEAPASPPAETRSGVSVPSWLAAALVVVLGLVVGAAGFALGRATDSGSSNELRPVVARGPALRGGPQGPGGQRGGCGPEGGGQHGPEGRGGDQTENGNQNNGGDQTENGGQSGTDSGQDQGSNF